MSITVKTAEHHLHLAVAFVQKVALRNEWCIFSYIWKNRHSIFSNLLAIPLQPLRFYHTFYHQQLMCSVFVILHTDEGPSSAI